MLVVDLDGTLLRSDMLHESFWSAFARDWMTPFGAIKALGAGKAALKSYLAAKSDIDFATLPYDAEVVQRVKDWRAAGGKTALVTATHQSLADGVGAELGLFDDVIGTQAETNLKGAAKADRLVSLYGEGGFIYMGDHAADVAIWKHAAKAITVNASGATRAAVRCSGEIEHLDTLKPSLRPYMKAIRPHQWLKNILVFLPILAAHQVTFGSFFTSLLAFISFSLIASSVYVTNDLLDLAGDRAHPRKCKRPFAAGTIPIRFGGTMAGGLLAAGCLTAALLGWQFFLVMIGYYVLTTAYSLYLKRRLLVDIIALACLYTVRILAGAAASGLHLTVWLLAFSVFFFLSLAAVKRQAELVDGIKAGKAKAHGRGYEAGDLMMVAMMSISAGYTSVLVMALYLNSPAVTQLYKSPSVLWGICIVMIYWLSRMAMMTHRGRMHDDPVVFAAKDKVSLSCFALIFCIALIGKFF